MSVVEKSADRKLSTNNNVSATWVPQYSCSSDCPLKDNGCYAEVGHAGIQTHRLNRLAKAAKRSLTALRRKLAVDEAAGIRRLTGTRQLRVHAVGDCATPQAAGLVGQAMVEHQQKHGKTAWTYTHSWRHVARAAWRGANVLASCDNVTQIKAARARGYATSVVVPPHPTNKIYRLGGERIVPCPAQFKHGGKRVVTCEFCTLCKRPKFLREQRLSIGFEPDSGTAPKIMVMLKRAA